MNYDLTKGNITRKMLQFAFPLMVGNFLQQIYNIVDMLIVGRKIGTDALASVGASYTLMTFVTSMILGLCMGCGAFFSIQFGRKDYERLHNGTFLSLLMIGLFSVVMNLILYLFTDPLIILFQIPMELREMTKTYLLVIFAGIIATFLFNFFANQIRAVGNSMVPLVFLGSAAVGNIILDYVFVYVCNAGIGGAALATIICQWVTGIGIAVYAVIKFPLLRIRKKEMYWNQNVVKEMAGLSVLTGVQQSIMNFGILLIQGLVNSFGPVIMAAFAIAVKIDTLAYMPAQDFGNAFSTFVAQNNGAGEYERIHQGRKKAIRCILFFCVVISFLVCLFAEPLMQFFMEQNNPDIVEAGVLYLRIEGGFYVGIGLLFLLYGYYRAMNRPGMSVVLTIISLGTRVVLAYALSAIPEIGVIGIWVAIPIGWVLADVVGFHYVS